MKYSIRILWAVVWCVYAYTANTYAQTQPDGTVPGGADLGLHLQLWLDANDISTMYQNTAGTTPVTGDGQQVRLWQDKSGSNNHAVLVSGQSPANYESDAGNLINGKPVLHFSRTNATNGVAFESSLDIRAGTNNQITIFTVYKPTTLTVTGGGGEGLSIWGNDNNNFDRFFYTLWTQSTFTFGADGIDDGVISLGGATQATVVRDAGKVGEIRLLTSVYDHNVSNGSAIYFDGDLQVAFTDQSHLTDALPNFQIGRDGNNSMYEGDLAEIIAYNRKLTLCEIEEVNKYLGEKYGKDFTGFANSYSYTGTFANNVSAIGQKTDACSGTERRDTAYSEELMIFNPTSNDTDDEFLSFAHNGSSSTGVSFSVPTGLEGRKSRIWRIDEDGDLGNVDVAIHIGGLNQFYEQSNYVLVKDTDSNFSDATIVATTSVVVNDTVTFTGVHLNDGEYITLAYGTLPAGIPNVELWLRADKDVTGTTSVTQWGDQTTGANHAYHLNSGTPNFTLSESGVNFNPEIDYTGSNRNFRTSNDLTLQEFFVVARVDPSVPALGGLIGIDNDRGIRSITSAEYRGQSNSGNSQDWYFDGGSQEINGIATDAHNNEWHIIRSDRASALTDQLYVGGYYNGTGTPLSRPYRGEISEILAFSTTQNADNRQKIWSYLALKYGITLNNGSSPYVSSYGTLFWSPDPVYKHGVFGLGRDDISGLYQKISTSINDQLMVVSLDDNWIVSNTNALRIGTIDADTNFVTLSHNGANKDWTTGELCVCKDHYRINREWQVQVTGQYIDSVYIGVHKDSLTQLSEDIELYVLVDQDGNFSEAPYQEYEMQKSGDIYRVKIPIEHNDYITFAMVRKTGRMRNRKRWLFSKQTTFKD